jgi:hypothetical protein
LTAITTSVTAPMSPRQTPIACTTPIGDDLSAVVMPADLPRTFAWKVHELRQLDNLLYTFYAVIHRDLKDRMLFLDHQSRFFRSFPARIRGFCLPIHLEAKSAVPRAGGPCPGTGHAAQAGVLLPPLWAVESGE